MCLVQLSHSSQHSSNRVATLKATGRSFVDNFAWFPPLNDSLYNSECAIQRPSDTAQPRPAHRDRQISVPNHLETPDRLSNVTTFPARTFLSHLRSLPRNARPLSVIFTFSLSTKPETEST
ncbi:hypothetical protein E2C01_092045 [Portunus trituberculatus]|uniref:Uncharacterized protein n=1 Tax=Portunus trituberculatus TaxID=210409 RepID=A0A5B7JUR4_PORTR|nr:hypothetical protein [Portunus trituberculatus]